MRVSAHRNSHKSRIPQVGARIGVPETESRRRGFPSWRRNGRYLCLAKGPHVTAVADRDPRRADGTVVCSTRCRGRLRAKHRDTHTLASCFAALPNPSNDSMQARARCRLIIS